MKAEADAALAAMRAAWKPLQVHEVGKVPASPVTPYAVVTASTGSPGNGNLAGQWGSKTYRVVVQAFGRTLSEIAAPVEAADVAFLNTPLIVVGQKMTPPDPADVVSSQIIRDPDGGGLLACTVIYPITAYPTEQS